MDLRTSNNQSKFNYGESKDDFNGKSEPDLDAGEGDVDLVMLMKEKMSLNKDEYPNTLRLINKEVDHKSRKNVQFVDIYREKVIKVSAKVLVPVLIHPNFNFVGKLLGPKGNSLKKLQEDTMSRMFIMGRGSMRDKEKEEELRQSDDPKYAHLKDDLHVEISVLAPPAEAHARMAHALAELRKYLIPDYFDEIRREQMQQIQAAKTISGTAGPTGPQRQRPSLPFAGKSILQTIRQKAYAASNDSYNYYPDEAGKWQSYNEYGNGRAYNGTVSSFNSYNNYAANKTVNGRGGRRLL
ncbi:KH domain-containing, RNA-binding, signal transduction-associated protein 3-like isoform X1 [Nilaparvata lugens]|uniref:KH domain-containing, RNA-binding, signal transduction-associated protein 3-like isoform X1 n=1 Tax=Nilaparvata lugens TaxID=108931 RepID=UPI00193D06D7|nr:KH domain-containing, RNA-binding, signal transduction-associated protein 3-like isoform X1 [Nilaparvata lugens]XP_039301025.1 KH domain-containing, RNA-binding, signal transduction-associated protein 3-like isoform X1 [Nilaparvata lugens]